MSEPTEPPVQPRLHARLGRPPLKVGTHGMIRAKKVAGEWIADTRVRDNDGKVRQVRRKGATKDAAVSTLRAAIAARPGFSERTIPPRPYVSPNRLVTSECAHPHVLYRFFNSEDELVYVGISLSGLRRMSQHSRKPWWSEVARTELVHFPDRESAREAERIAIRDEAPLYNIAS